MDVGKLLGLFEKATAAIALSKADKTRSAKVASMSSWTTTRKLGRISQTMNLWMTFQTMNLRGIS
jgi:hypothetical protein